MNIPSLAPVLRIVPDTNFLISAFLFPGSQPARALATAQRTGKILCSKETLTELTGVLFRPKFDRNSSIEARIRTLLDFRKTVEVVTVQTIIAECRHPKADKFLALALDGEAHLLLTGDSDLLTLNPWRGVQILRPGAFIEAMTQPAPIDIP